ncbi:hypothetical protein [Rhodopirellula sallentina]|uniref:Uncharacterized protein n=1 Tax=Rhodopirellula sallentina SM41 TaxID=1263870 RepID=M5TY87_9BACT|nr:hypothetical protein [Rhodopirellula sallentina]EMI54177.1 hypothetical protein RSSM_04396 [Rhodopirellula sallentina SM41]
MTTATLTECEVLDLANELAGNWKRMDCFAWFREREIDDSDQWAIIYTHHRESGLLERSNAGVIGKAMMPFTEKDDDDPDVVMETHSHFAVGWIAGFSIRCLDEEGIVTEAFKRYAELHVAMDQYSILDEEDYSNREYEATVENIVDAAKSLNDEYELSDDWQYQVYSWLSDNECGELESTSDHGGCPSEEALLRAMNALFKRNETE